jgi:hypothetical protein
MINAEITDIDADAILKLYRPQPKIVEVQKVV